MHWLPLMLKNDATLDPATMFATVEGDESEAANQTPTSSKHCESTPSSNSSRKRGSTGEPSSSGSKRSRALVAHVPSVPIDNWATILEKHNSLMQNNMDNMIMKPIIDADEADKCIKLAKEHGLQIGTPQYFKLARMFQYLYWRHQFLNKMDYQERIDWMNNCPDV